MRDTLKWIYSVYRRNKKGILISLFFAVLASLAGIVTITLYYPTLAVFTGANAKNSIGYKLLKYVGITLDAQPSLFLLIGLLISLQILRTVFLVISRIVSNRYEYEFIFRLKKEFLRQFTLCKWIYIIQTKSGRLLNTFTTHTTQASKAVYCLVESMVAMVESLAGLCFAFFVSPHLAAVLILFAVILTPTLRLIHNHIRYLVNKRIKLQNELSNKFIEYFSGFKTFKSMALESLYLNEINSDLHSFTRNEKRAYRVQILLNQSTEPIFFLLGAVFLLIAHYWFSVGMEAIVIFFALIHKITSQLKILQVNMGRFVTNIPSISECDAIEHKMLSAAEKHEGEELSGRIHKIEAKNLSFSYPDGTVVFKNISFEINCDKSLIALYGPSGIGKSTLLDILSGLIEPSEGSCLINNVPVTDLNIHELRKRMGFVPQNPILFNRSLIENISLRPGTDVDMDQIISSARMADAHGFIGELSAGYNTIIGNEGTCLSQGQIQRISIARALYQNPEILFCDEPTSALDNNTANEIIAILRKISQRYPVFIISHDVDILRRADQAIILDKEAVSLIQQKE